MNENLKSARLEKDITDKTLKSLKPATAPPAGDKKVADKPAGGPPADKKAADKKTHPLPPGFLR